MVVIEVQCFHSDVAGQCQSLFTARNGSPDLLAVTGEYTDSWMSEPGTPQGPPLSDSLPQALCAPRALPNFL